MVENQNTEQKNVEQKHVEPKHFFTVKLGCPIHQFNHSEDDKICNCRSYWEKLSEVSDKAIRDDHNYNCPTCLKQGANEYDKN